MDKSKNNLMKSKSSNGTTTTSKKQPRRNDKKSRSNAEIKPMALKKRGVYVKNKPTKSSLNEPPGTIANGFKCRPRPDKKHFVTSVMTILSKTTARTQYPNSNNASFTKHGVINNLKNSVCEEVVDEIVSIAKKKKYRSRVLNKIENDMNDIVVLQGKKTMSPSSNTLNSYSELDNEEWSDILPEVEPQTDNFIEDDMFRIVEHDESTVTLVNVEQDNYKKKLYSFFVDLLETTFDVYDGNTALHTPLSTSEKSSKVSLEIDEHIAKKLNIVKRKPKTQTVKVCEENKCYFFNSCNVSNQSEPTSKSVITIDMSNGKRKSKTKTFDYKNKISRVTHEHKVKSYPWNLKSSQKEQKRNLMKLLKEQLMKEKKREPHNFFQALKLMAKNKEQNETSTVTNESKKIDNDDDNFKCRFKRRRLLSRMSKKSNMSPLSTRKSLR